MVDGLPRSVRLPIIIALDPPYGVDPIGWCQGIIDDTVDMVVGYKIGLPLVLDCGRNDLGEIVGRMGSDLLRIADLKLADIGDIMVSVIRRLKDIGFNAFIVHGFTGYRDALEKVSGYLRNSGGKMITVVSMSHRGSIEVIDGVLDKLLDIALKSGSWGVVAPATRPKVIKIIRRKLGGKVKILSPGIGVQGAYPGDAIKAGADIEIIGRLITRSSDPRRTIMELHSVYR